MKVFGKWLVKAEVEGAGSRVAASFMTKKEAEEALTRAFPRENNIWTDGRHTRFYIEKNVKEYK